MKLRPRHPDRDVALWRRQILSAVLWALALLSSIAYLLGVSAALAVGDLMIVAFNTVAFAGLWALVLLRLGYAIKAWGLLLLCNGVGLYFTTRFGPLAAGPSWLLATPLLAAILFGKRVAIGHIAAMTTALVAVTLLRIRGLLGWSDAVHLDAWLAICGSLVALATLLALSASFLLEKLASTNTDLERVIAEREAAEARLVQAEKMEAIGRLAGGVAHDFNNLLTANLAFTEFARESLDTDHPARADLDESLHAIDRCRQLTGELLAFSRQRRVAPEIIDPRQVIGRIAETLDRVLRDDIVLSTDLTGAGSIEIDPGALERVLMNLAVNAQDAMPDGGELIFSVADRRFGEGDPGPEGDPIAPGDYVCLAVTDTGVGMSAEVLESIFEPFFTTKEVGKGTGLGLAASFGIVKQAGGYLGTTSEPGRGTSFEMCFPRRQAQAPADAGGAADAERGGSGTVLVAEDSDEVRRVVARTLRRAGYEVIEASDGAEALEALERLERGPDLVISDVVMPAMSGPDFVAAARQLVPTLDVLMISGHALEHREALAGEHTLSKPFTADQLLRAVRRALSG